jgi:hypothetical protein
MSMEVTAWVSLHHAMNAQDESSPARTRAWCCGWPV